jgi:hypothetical protein
LPRFALPARRRLPGGARLDERHQVLAVPVPELGPVKLSAHRVDERAGHLQLRRLELRHLVEIA